jgi:hypothetical protein
MLSWPWYLQVPIGISFLAFVYVFSYFRLPVQMSWDFSTRASYLKRAEEKGCQPCKHRSDGFYSWKFFAENMRNLRAHTVLDHQIEKHKRYGANTFSTDWLGSTVFETIEPANIQSVLATDFESWGLGKNRKPLIPLLGKGIFSSDGAQWKHSRELLRPSFARAHISDLEQFDRHVGNLIQKIPRDGSTIDILPLLYNFAMDASTEFLFGYSTNILAKDSPPKETVEFVKAWNRGIETMLGKGRLGVLTLFFEDPAFYRDCKSIQSMADHHVI